MLPGFLAPAAQVFLITGGAPTRATYRILGPTNPYVGWLNALGLTCFAWLNMSDQEKTMLVATRRFNDYGLFLSRDYRVVNFVAQVNAACKNAGPGNLSVPPAIAPIPNTGLSVPPAIAPAGQVTAAPATVVTSNSLGQVVNQAGVPLTDASGNTMQYAGNQRGHMGRKILGLLVVAAIVAVPVYAGAYYGTRKARA